jgi:LysM repeat protein
MPHRSLSHDRPASHSSSRPFLPAPGIIIALSAALLLLTGCAGNNTGKPVGAPSGTNGPRPGLPRHEYPFDSSGRYRTDWVSGSSSSSEDSSESEVKVASSPPPAPRRSSSSTASTAPPSSTYRAPSPAPPAPTPAPKPQAKRHTVARGDTLSAIGRRYGSSVSAIQQANGLSGDLIHPGQVLRIP